MHYKLSFVQTYNEENADIIVRWQRNFADNILGVSPFQTVGRTIVRSDIQLAMYYPSSNAPIPMEELKGIAVHEMGHAIGIRGHSPYPDDIMFYSKTRPQSAPSARDVNTVGMLYKLEADVQNNTSMSTAQTRQYYDLYDRGLKAQTSNRPADAMGYYRQAIRLNGGLPEAKFNLGALLINDGNKLLQQGNLLAAKRNMEEAVSLYSQVATNPQAPSATQDNLEIARNNLSIINEALKK
jgi:tetratricopeptide (TPR) repeat protein